MCNLWGGRDSEGAVVGMIQSYLRDNCADVRTFLILQSPGLCIGFVFWGLWRGSRLLAKPFVILPKEFLESSLAWQSSYCSTLSLCGRVSIFPLRDRVPSVAYFPSVVDFAILSHFDCNMICCTVIWFRMWRHGKRGSLTGSHNSKSIYGWEGVAI